MDEVSIRRLHLSDEQWERTSQSWKELTPRRNFNEMSVFDESNDDYNARINDMGFDIPIDVSSQWLYSPYYDERSTENYGWINYRQAIFVEMGLAVEELLRVNVVNEYQEYVEGRARLRPFDEFLCTHEDKESWVVHGTWRIAPIIINVDTFPNPPLHAELRGPLQLLEGHTRLGYLYALERAGLLTMREHKVFCLENLS